MKSIYRFGWLLLVLIFTTGIVTECSKTQKTEPSQETEMTRKPIEQVLKEHTPHLMSIPGVTGTGEGDLEGKPCIKVYVVKETEEIKGQIPKEIEGYPVDIQESGIIKPLNDD